MNQDKTLILENPSAPTRLWTNSCLVSAIQLISSCHLVRSIAASTMTDLCVPEWALSLSRLNLPIPATVFPAVIG
jgi:hypothetical protein